MRGFAGEIQERTMNRALLNLFSRSSRPERQRLLLARSGGLWLTPCATSVAEINCRGSSQRILGSGYLSPIEITDPASLVQIH
jgi:hypothetical protein